MSEQPKYIWDDDGRRYRVHYVHASDRPFIYAAGSQYEGRAHCAIVACTGRIGDTYLLTARDLAAYATTDPKGVSA